MEQGSRREGGRSGRAGPAAAEGRDRRGRHNLPVPATPLIGRAGERRSVRGALLDPRVRLVTLTGAPGIGKTRLALAVAASLVRAFPDGVWFVSLAEVEDPGRVAPAIARALKVRLTGRRPAGGALADHLRRCAVLLVLDNFEHLLGAAPLVAALLAAGPEVKALVTSRAALRLCGERVFPVPPLTLPGPRLGTPEAMAAVDAVRLFVERARALVDRFALTPQNAQAVAEVCRRLDGLPLAIELAAARIGVLPPGAMAGRLERRLALLTGGPGDLPRRQQTLRGEIAWSYDLLDARERRLFQLLGLFAGGCTLEALEAVAPATASSASSVQPPAKSPSSWNRRRSRASRRS